MLCRPGSVVLRHQFLACGTPGTKRNFWSTKGQALSNSGMTVGIGHLFLAFFDHGSGPESPAIGPWVEAAFANDKSSEFKSSRLKKMQPYDLKSMSVDELLSLHEFVSSALVRRIPTETARLDQRLRQLRLGAVSRHTKMSHAPRHYPQVFPKYRNPAEPSETWAGRKSGKRIDDFRIDLAAA
jgi:DNA-binding protein H-NS